MEQTENLPKKKRLPILFLFSIFASFFSGIILCIVFWFLLLKPGYFSQYGANDINEVFVARSFNSTSRSIETSLIQTTIQDGDLLSSAPVYFSDESGGYTVVYNPFWLSEQENEFEVTGDCYCCDDDEFSRRSETKLQRRVVVEGACFYLMAVTVLVVATSIAAAKLAADGYLYNTCANRCGQRVGEVSGRTTVKEKEEDYPSVWSCSGSCIWIEDKNTGPRDPLYRDMFKQMIRECTATITLQVVAPNEITAAERFHDEMDMNVCSRLDRYPFFFVHNVEAFPWVDVLEDIMQVASRFGEYEEKLYKHPRRNSIS